LMFNEQLSPTESMSPYYTLYLYYKHLTLSSNALSKPNSGQLTVHLCINSSVLLIFRLFWFH